jgi:CheY-like chemotaxis protein
MLPEGLRFSIRDQGIGLSEEQLTRLFTPFTQFDSSFAKKYQGNGLGLSITRHILNLMGSEPRVESAIGKGSTFSFTLPLQSIVARETKRDLPSPPRADLAEIELDVMVVEDNRLNMLLAETVLRDIAPRIRIHKASNGLEAIKHMESGLAPDIVFMDLQMPIMDGFETTAVIRELYQAPMRIVALTASAVSEVRDRCLASGMDEFLTKPFTRDQMAQLLQRHVTGG